MIRLVDELEKSCDKASQENYERLYTLYQTKKSQITLDGKKAIICRLSSKFPIVVIVSNNMEVEYSAKTIERILNNSCKFKS